MADEALESDSTIPVRIIRSDRLGSEALADVVEGLGLYEFWWRLATFEVRQRFHRSVLGPLWITLSMGITVGALGLVFSTLFGQDVSHTLPHIALGLIFWGLLTSCINEGATVFTGNEAYVRNVPLPLTFHVYRMLARNLIVLGFNLSIYVVVFIAFGVTLDWQTFLVIPGFALFMLNAAWMALAVGIVSTRFRDVPMVVTNMLQVVFFLTPVFWSTASLPSRPAFVEFNPLYHLLELVRAPLLGDAPPPLSWGAASLMAAVGLAVTAWLFRRAYGRIAYWV